MPFYLSIFEAIGFCLLVSFEPTTIPLVYHSYFVIEPETVLSSCLSFRYDLYCCFITLVSIYPIIFSFPKNFIGYSHTVVFFIQVLLKFPLFLT
jgi:hypothetical protein